jgi:teichuronic acid biosynthesis glycosyltransferase TuaC
MNKDVIVDRYARLYEIPFQLANLGHDVIGFCLSYRRNSDDGRWKHETQAGSLEWESRSLGALLVPALLAYPRTMLRRLRDFRPDIIIGASDIPHVALGAWLAKKLNVPFVADLYDNFEGFGQAKFPGMVSVLRRSVRNAELVVTTSELLRDLVVAGYKARGEIIAMPSSVDKTVFHPRDRLECRRALGLPQDAQLIGTAGGLYREKGITALYDAWEKIRAISPNIHLVLAGPIDQGLQLPTGDQVHYLGALAHSRVAELFCALDVGVICILDTPFGRYCFPQKAYEMLACDLQIVAADVGAMHMLLQSFPSSRYRVDDSVDLAEKLLRQLNSPQKISVRIDDWRSLISSLEPQLRKVVEAHNAR